MDDPALEHPARGAGRQALAALALTVQALVLFVPRAPQVDTGGLPVDKLVHVGVFALPTLALIRAGSRPGVTIGVMVGYAVASEVIQGTFYRQRSGDPGDVAADLLGVALGALAARGLDRHGDRARAPGHGEG